jgi:hypothetical protein
MPESRAVALWDAPTVITVSDRVTDPAIITESALLLRPRERNQIVANLQAGHFEVATTFVWQRTMTLLKKQLSTLGNEFVGELLQRPDIDDNSEITTVVSDREAISLARDLGVLTPTQAMRLVHSQEVVNHFASVDDQSLTDDDMMTQEDAISCLRVCVQGILGHQRIGVAEDFSAFRKSLETVTFTSDSTEILRLEQSPYLFVRTAISVLLSVLKKGSGATLEHASRNALLIVPILWDRLKKAERWQLGQAYASEFNEGHKETVRALHAVLVAVKGFDYVPENLRSTTFTRVASTVIAAHQGVNNFYNEPSPMKELASLGTSIPSPALPLCMTAALCVKLGNSWGTSWAAQSPATEVLNSISKERWLYYLDDRLERDLVILPKLASAGRTVSAWIELVAAKELSPSLLAGKHVKALLTATNKNQPSKVNEAAMAMLSQSSSS